MKKEKFKWAEEMEIKIPEIKIEHITRFIKDAAYKESWITRVIKHFFSVPVTKFKYLYKIDMVIQQPYFRKGQTVHCLGERFIVTEVLERFIAIQSMDYTDQDFNKEDFKDKRLIPGGCLLTMS